MTTRNVSDYAVGPTWSKNPDGTWCLPKYSLGWEIAHWVGTYIRQPNGERAKQPFMFTPEQFRFILWWYAVDEHSGRWLYRGGTLRRLKGWG